MGSKPRAAASHPCLCVAWPRGETCDRAVSIRPKAGECQELHWLIVCHTKSTGKFRYALPFYC